MADPNPTGSALEHAMWLAGLDESATIIACVFEKGERYIVALFRALSLGGPDLCPRRITEERHVLDRREVKEVLETLSQERGYPPPPVFLHQRGTGEWPFEWRFVDERLELLLVGGAGVIAGYRPT